MPKIVDPHAQRRQIRRAARDVFSRRGLAGTGLAQVADAAGMGRSSLYHYYPDKESLVRDLVRDLLAAEESLFERAARAPGRPLERIEGLVADLTGVFEEWRSAGRLLAEVRTGRAREFRAFFRRIRDRLADMIEAGQRAGEIDRDLDPHLAAAVVIGAVDGLLLQYAVDPRAFPDSAALRRQLVDAAHKVLRP
jgi:AcrR family transcriptional regulator